MTAKQVQRQFEAGASLPIWLILNTLQNSKSVTQTQQLIEEKYEYE
jgi:hypothetical protein